MTSLAASQPPVVNTGLGSETTMSLSQSMDSVNTTPDDEVRTLFVSGLPMDAKPRELYLLFRSYKGYESSLLKMMNQNKIAATKPNVGYEGSLLKVTNKNGKTTSAIAGLNGAKLVLPPVGFVTFNRRGDAEVAKQDLQGVRFDPDLPQTLRLEFAKSNTKVTKPKQQSPQPPAAVHPTLVHPITGQELGAAAFFPGMAAPEAGWAAHPLTTGYADLASPAAALHHPTLIQHPALAQIPGLPMHPAAMQAAVPHVPHLSAASSSMIGTPVAANSAGPTTPVSSAAANAPCSTLFVANLGPFCSEQELKDLFGSFPGFSRLRMHNKGGSPVAFVEYQDRKGDSSPVSSATVLPLGGAPLIAVAPGMQMGHPGAPIIPSMGAPTAGGIISG